MDDLISRQAAIDEVHTAIYEFFDICDDDEESPMTYKDKKLLEINKAITIRIRQLPSVERIGHWEPLKEIAREMVGDATIAISYGGWQCSECKYTVKEREPLWKFCPYCGASMRGDEE